MIPFNGLLCAGAVLLAAIVLAIGLLVAINGAPEYEEEVEEKEDVA